MIRISSKLQPILKIVLGAAFLIWMVYSGKLDLSQIARSLSHWPELVAILILLYTQVAVTAWRWNLLLKAQEIHFPYGQAMNLTMIGVLFNVVIPGAVGGDLMKAYYVTRAAAGRKSPAATSILMDRVLGLQGLFLLSALMVAVNFHQLQGSQATRRLGMLVVAGAAAGLIVLYTAVISGVHISEWRHVPNVVRNVFRALSEYHRRVSVIPIAIGVSILAHLLACIAYYLALRTVGASGSVSPADFFLLVPLGLISTAIPISPAGIGVGQAAFFALFHLVSATQATAAASAFTIFQMVTLVIYLSGFVPYLSYKHAVVEVQTVAEPER
jgi:hypothetical protein